MPGLHLLPREGLSRVRGQGRRREALLDAGDLAGNERALLVVGRRLGEELAEHRKRVVVPTEADERVAAAIIARSNPLATDDADGDGS